MAARAILTVVNNHGFNCRSHSECRLPHVSLLDAARGGCGHKARPIPVGVMLGTLMGPPLGSLGLWPSPCRVHEPGVIGISEPDMAA